jgi:hypothetical protein
MLSENGAVGGMRTEYSEKTIPVPPYPPKIPHELTVDHTKALMVGS